MTVNWRLKIGQLGYGNRAYGDAYGEAYAVYDDRLLDVKNCTLTYNRFARTATVVLDDPDGTIPEELPRPSAVQLEVKRESDTDWTTRFGGFVNNPKSNRHTTTLELLSHDFWLRGRDVYRGYTDATISTILADLVGDLTPLKWDAERVEIYDDKTITRDWKGESLDKVIAELASASNDEIFGATDDMTFFFEQRDSKRAPRDFTAGEYFDIQFEEDGTYELNEVTIYYGGNPATEAAVVEDRQSQRALKDELGATTNVVVSDSKTYTEIADEAAAVRKGKELLEDASQIQTGELETWEGFDIQPGDLTRVVVPEQNVDADFRVAEISHSWQDDSTTVKLAENREGVVDALMDLSDEVSRVDARAASNDATLTRFTELGMDFEVDLGLEVYQRQHASDEFSWGSFRQGWGAGGKLGDMRSQPTKIIDINP